MLCHHLCSQPLLLSDVVGARGCCMDSKETALGDKMGEVKDKSVPEGSGRN